MNQNQRRFRVWNKDLKEYETKPVFLTQNGTVCYENGDAYAFKCKIEFCTGKADAHGNFIYDGDIICEYMNGEYDEDPKIIGWAEAYSGEQWCVVDKNGKAEEYYYGGMPDDTEQHYRIVGNIHEGVKK